MTSQNLKLEKKMTELLALSAVLLAVALPLYYLTLTVTRKEVLRATQDELVAEIEKLNEALLNVSVKLQDQKEYSSAVVSELFKAETQSDKILEVARTTLGYVQLYTGDGFSYRKPFGEKLPEWDVEGMGSMEGWEQIRKDLEAVLPKV